MKWQREFRWLVVSGIVLAGVLLIGPASARGRLNLLHEFLGGADDGYVPYSAMVLDGKTLYGAAAWGGDDDRGVVFEIQTDGTGYRNIYEFTTPASNPIRPKSGLTMDGDWLYGTTREGGAGDLGAVYKVKKDGSGYQTLHEFAGGTTDGGWPEYGPMAFDGTYLYGTAEIDGPDDNGIVFRLTPDGKSYDILHSFAGGTKEGASTKAGLTLVGTTLYGTTYGEGAGGHGTLFKMETDGTGFSVLHHFAGGVDDGAGTVGAPVVVGAYVYGMAATGGDDDVGVIYRIDTDGSNYKHLHEFTGGPDGGKWPDTNLLLFGDTLFGTTRRGGPGDTGVLFRIETDATGFQIIHKFRNNADDGGYPQGWVVTDGTLLFGLTPGGGDDGYGVIYASDMVPEPTTLALVTLGAGGLLLRRRRR